MKTVIRIVKRDNENEPIPQQTGREAANVSSAEKTVKAWTIT